MSNFVNWNVWQAGGLSERERLRVISALSAGAAVEEWARYWDSYTTEFEIVGGQDKSVFVQLAFAGAPAPERWIVSGHPMPVYTAVQAS